VKHNPRHNRATVPKWRARGGAGEGPERLPVQPNGIGIFSVRFNIGIGIAGKSPSFFRETIVVNEMMHNFSHRKDAKRAKIYTIS
jgi:hypothetical protein